VLAKLGLHRRVVSGRIGAVQRREIEYVHEQAAALDVREKLVAEARARTGALDQAGNVGQHELALFALEGAEHGLERRERVVGHLGLGASQPSEQ
jgi:hypothetical protein